MCSWNVNAFCINDSSSLDRCLLNSFNYISCLFQEALLRYDGYGSEEDEWVSIVQNLRLRSFPCEETECVLLLPGDPVLCFQVCRSTYMF